MRKQSEPGRGHISAGKKEMKHYLDLVSISAGARRRQSRMTRICIILAVFLAASIFSMADMEIRSQTYQVIQQNGAWQAAFMGLTREQEELIQARAGVQDTALCSMMEPGTEEGFTLEGVNAQVIGMSSNITDMMPYVKVQEGHFPKGADEAAVTESACARLGARKGDQVALKTPEGEELSFEITGILEDTDSLNSRDGVVLFVNTRAFDESAGLGNSQDRMLLARFSPLCRVEKTVEDICAQLSIDRNSAGLNAKLLALQFQSRDSSMTGLYGTAAVLAVLVAAAGVLMISASMNSSVARRTRFFGMMRCLGADRRQVRRMVRREALNWCRTAIPAGVAMSILVVWGLCAMLKALSPSFFSGMPVFGVSVPGIIAGVLIGLVTVLLAARSPAERAAKVPPLTAVSGNAGGTQAVRRAANTRFLPVETALGIHHATGSRKNFFLMTGSFAFSIILFLSFTPALDFMNHAIKPLRPSAPDMSIISADQTCSVPRALAEEIKDDPAVKKVYGRSIVRAVTARVGEEEFQVDLVSYEENQFEWAEDSLAEGSLEDAEKGKGVLAVQMDAAHQFSPGDEIRADLPSRTVKVSVSGVLNESVFHGSEDSVILICSEELFRELTGQTDYAEIDLQLKRGAEDKDAERIRTLVGDSFTVEDNRQGNSEVRGGYFSFALFLYGFLVVIALISVFNIINSISMSVSAKLRQYGTMRAVGMSTGQLVHMVAAEAASYVVSGIITGCAAGLLLNWKIYGWLVTSRWGTPWEPPLSAIAVIFLLIVLSALAAVAGPARRIREMSVADTIGALG